MSTFTVNVRRRMEMIWDDLSQHTLWNLQTGIRKSLWTGQRPKSTSSIKLNEVENTTFC